MDDYTGKAITLSLYPDPVTDYCTVQINQELNGRLRIYDVFGRICYQQMISGRQWSFPFEQVPGYYLLEIVGTTGAVRTSFLKK